MTPRIARADAIILGDEAPLRDGALVVTPDGTLLDVGPADEIVPRHAGLPVDRVRGVLMPGLVNAHAHLELSGLRGKVQGGHGFVPWVDRLMGLRESEGPEGDPDAIGQAVSELCAFGTVAVGDVTNTLAAVEALGRRRIGGVVFHEVFGLDREQSLTRLGAMKNEQDAREAECQANGLTYTLAPHTVYTTHPDAVRAVVEEVRARGAKTTVHLAEHPAERTFLMSGSGPFFDFAARMGFPVGAFPIPGKGPVAVAADLGLLSSNVLLVHLTDVRPDELELVASSGAAIVLCPRSNLFIELRLPPLPEILRQGIVPALGTDSLASNTSLDLLAEARALGDRFPSVPKRTLLQMATAAGARALGRADLGRLARGLRPGILAIEGDVSTSEDPCGWVLKKPAAARRWFLRRSAPHQLEARA